MEHQWWTLPSGDLSGSVWGANVGWLSLSNATAHVQTLALTPPNDLCANPIMLTNGVSCSQLTSTATSAGDPTSLCGAAVGKGVWFTYTPLLSGVVTVSTCGSELDTVLGVYTGSCGALSLAGCDDDNGSACAGVQASMTFIGVSGVTYYIYAGGYNSASGTLNIVASSPSNDSCTSALPLTDGVAFAMNTSSATSAGDPLPPCQPNSGKSVWFSYTAPADGEVVVNTCGSSFDTVLTVYTGSCRLLAAMACNDDYGPACAGTQASVRFTANAGATYLLLMGGYNGASGALSVVASLVPVISYATSSGSIALSWAGNGTLQSTTNLNPVVIWTDVTNSGGAWAEPMTNRAKFFRIVK